MDAILQHLSLTIQIGKASPFLGVRKNGIVSDSKNGIAATLCFAGLQNLSKFGHGSFQMMFANTLGAEFILIDAA